MDHSRYTPHSFSLSSTRMDVAPINVGVALPRVGLIGLSSVAARKLEEAVGVAQLPVGVARPLVEGEV